MNKVKLLHSKRVYTGKISIRKDEFILQDKKIQKEIVEHSPSVGLVPIIDDSNILLITQYRHPAKRTLLEIPAGKIEDGETKEQAARRELYEETGYAGTLSFLTKWYLAPSRSEEHTSELQSQSNLVCRLLLEKKKKRKAHLPQRDRM